MAVAVRIPKQVARFRVNGSDCEVAVRPYDVLLDVIREDLSLTGTKRGCDMGTCGCCTVLLDGRPTLSCLTLALEAEAPREITTLEGIRGKGGELHPLQECFAEAGGSQCGFCTPGFILSALELLRRNARPSDAEIRDAISGNICRCTGYVKIVEAVRLASERMVARP